MEQYLKNHLETLRKEFCNISKLKSRVKSDIGIRKERVFRRFINDIFPYYDAFKGDVFGKSCDFVLADKFKHPRFNTDPKSDEYFEVITSLVETVMDLKGTTQKSEIENGISQAKQIKSFLKGKAYVETIKVNYNDFWTELKKNIINHVLIFIKGGTKEYIDFVNKYLLKTNGVESNINERTEKFIKLPDIVFFIEKNEIIFKEGFDFHVAKTDGILLFATLIEILSQINNINKLIAINNSLNEKIKNIEPWIWNLNKDLFKNINNSTNQNEIINFLKLKDYKK